MGFYLRKSISVGPFRFNFSKSGVGISAGVKGLRIGTGPRGNYVHMGRGGIYYRKTLSPHTNPAANTASEGNRHPEVSPREEMTAATHDAFAEVESGSALKMVDSSSMDLLLELNEKKKRMRYWPVAAVTGAILFLIVINNMAFPGWAGALILLMTIAGTIFAARLDKVRKMTVLFYNMEPDIEKAYQRLHDAFDDLLACSKVWCVDAISNVSDKKYHAGANNLVKTQNVTLSKGQPPYVATNIAVPSMPVGRQTLYFFPDKLIVRDGGGYGAVNYKELEIDISQGRLIYQESVPGDATVVDHTWKYVNKKGGPDKRFKDNQQLPIIQYSAVALKSASGLNEIVQLSKSGIGQKFKQSISELAAVT